jgi:hypothetical protein
LPPDQRRSYRGTETEFMSDGLWPVAMVFALMSGQLGIHGWQYFKLLSARSSL